jgi:hypothetical protein
MYDSSPIVRYLYSLPGKAYEPREKRQRAQNILPVGLPRRFRANLSFPVQVGPLAGDDEARPEVRMPPLFAL